MVSFNCSVCGKNFKEKLAMQIHERRHAVQKPETHWYGDVKLPVKYPCPICGKTFATKNYLNEHYRTHADGKPLAKFIITLGHWMIWVELMCLRRLKLYCVVSHCGQWAGLQWQCLLLSAPLGHISPHIAPPLATCLGVLVPALPTCLGEHAQQDCCKWSRSGHANCRGNQKCKITIDFQGWH